MSRKSVFENMGTGFSCSEIFQELGPWVDPRSSEI